MGLLVAVPLQNGNDCPRRRPANGERLIATGKKATSGLGHDDGGAVQIMLELGSVSDVDFRDSVGFRLCLRV